MINETDLIQLLDEFAELYANEPNPDMQDKMIVNYAEQIIEMFGGDGK